MHRPGLASLVLVFLPAATAQDAAVEASAKTRIPVSVDARVQLMSILFRLAGNPEYNMAKVKGYAEAVDAHFGPFKDHAAVKAAQSLRRWRGVSFDAVMAMAIHLRDAEGLEELVPLDPRPEGLDRRWECKSARAFLREARAFVVESKFAGFMAAQKDVHDAAVARARQVIDKEVEVSWFAKFFGARPGGRFELALGILNGGGNYGPHVRLKDGTEVLYCILGVWMVDGDGAAKFDHRIASTVAHEFCHSYCNPLVEAHAEALRAPGQQLFPLVQKGMKQQAYGNWKTMMYESLVRACVVRYVAATKGEAAAEREIGLQRRRSFLWTGELAAVLKRYEGQRDKYPTLAAYMPEVVKFFAGYAPEFVKKREAGEIKLPK